MKKQQKAFTLVELIVVITILAILGTIAFISMEGYSKSSRDSVRISDVSNMKTSLELFHLNAGKYPLPDNNEIVTYGGDPLWNQGTIGSIVVGNLSRNLNEIPTDPLSDKEYIYSTSGNRNEFQILNLLEGDIALNTILQTNAATSTRIPRLDGVYNGLYLVTNNYIVPTPSIVTSETITPGSGLILNGTNIQSQVTTGGSNIPNVGNINSNTGGLNITLSVYNGTITKNSTNTDKILAMQAIQGAYTGSDLSNSDIYKLILDKTTDEEILKLINTVILDLPNENIVSNSCDDTTKPADDLNKDYTVNPTSVNQAYVKNSTECGYTCTGGYTGDNCEIAPITDYPGCNEPDITVGAYTIAACNVGTNTASTAYNDAAGYGELFQWGNNAGIKTAGTSATLIGATTNDSTYSNATFISSASLPSPYDWTSSLNDNLWGNTTNTNEARKGPCATGYHVPTQSEWAGIHTAGGWGTNGLNMSNALKMPMAGDRSYSNASLINQGTNGLYWSSSPNGTNGYFMLFGSTNIDPSGINFRAYGFSVRCFKN